MAALSDMLTFLRKREELSQQELADKLNMTRSAIGMYETGKREPDLETLEVFADFYHVDMNTLTGRASVNGLPSNVLPLPATYTVPLIGSIACGKPVLCVEEAEETVAVPEGVHATFALRCKGDSMINARIFDGDIVYIRAQPEVENGDIAAVRIDDEATLKKVYVYGNRLVLRAANPMYEDLVFADRELDKVEVLGLAVAFWSHIQ